MGRGKKRQGRRGVGVWKLPLQVFVYIEATTYQFRINLLFLGSVQEVCKEHIRTFHEGRLGGTHG